MAFRVGLTGGIGAGKTELLHAFAHEGLRTLSLDEVAHELSKKGRKGHKAVVRAFGKGVLRPDGELDRKAVAARVFSDRRALKRLEKALHPLILREMDKDLKQAKGAAVVDVPLLFEARLADRFDLVVQVSAPLKSRRARVERRDGPGTFARRAAVQWPQARREAAADVVIDNDGSLSDLRRKAARYARAFDLISTGGRNG